jgi:hypothetical protein
MQTEKYYVIKPTTHSRKKVSYGDELALTESQARPLRNGGFVSPDKAAANFRPTQLQHAYFSTVDINGMSQFNF